jgi:hypothetical protein
MFYGSRSRIGCLLEGAHYALLFWGGLIDPPPPPNRRRQMLFSVLLKASRSLQLQAILAPAVQATLRDPIVYGPSQQLGEWMRDHGIEACEYLIARSSKALEHVAVLTPAVFQSTPFDQVEVGTEISADHASFLCHVSVMTMVSCIMFHANGSSWMDNCHGLPIDEPEANTAWLVLTCIASLQLAIELSQAPLEFYCCQAEQLQRPQPLQRPLTVQAGQQPVTVAAMPGQQQPGVRIESLGEHVQHCGDELAGHGPVRTATTHLRLAA